MARNSRKLLVPEVVQSSAMDCGPASLKCLLDGFGLNVSYDRLREACQTDVDGTSIDTLEEVAVQLGLDAEQVMIPVDHVLLPEAHAIPALTVVELASGLTHFVVAWRAHRHVMQLMDPATGRRWPSRRQFVSQLYVHRMPVPAAQWREWTETEDFAEPFTKRLGMLGASSTRAWQMLGQACGDNSWRSVAALDAATRMAASLMHARALPSGSAALQLVDRLWLATRNGEADGVSLVPPHYWSVVPADPDQDGDEQVTFAGAVLIRVRGLRADESVATVPVPADVAATTSEIPAPEAEEPADKLSDELMSALEEKPLHPGREILRILRLDGLLTPAMVAMALLLSSVGVIVEALIFRGLFDIGRELDLTEQRLGAMTMLVGFVGVMLLLEVPTVSLVRRMGRRLEARLRHLFLRRIPRLSDTYFSSRLTSDMAERSHSIHAVRDVTELGEGALRAIFSLLLTGSGLVWLDPASLPAVLLAIAVSVSLPLFVQPLMRERDLRVRSHQGALTRFYLDALLGVIPLRTHGATGAVREEHDNLVAEWLRAQGSLLRLAIPLGAVISLVGMAMAGVLLLGYVSRRGERLDLLLFVYWALSIPALGSRLASIAAQYPVAHNLTQRLLEPIAAPTALDDTEPVTSLVSGGHEAGAAAVGVQIALRQVSLKLAGRQVLDGVDLDIAPGEHLAVVGPSGAGKSSLVGLLLGWYQPARGVIAVDGRLLDGACLEQLRRQTAWVDPAVQLWNRSVLDNVRYGAPEGIELPFSRAIEQADLLSVLQTIPDGLQGHLGEGGALVSGGEGQRVRLARALLRPDVRLVILDEPFRGLDRHKRRSLMHDVRQWWRDATLVCISHDIEQTTDFDRVVVIQDGRVAEQGRPPALVTDKRSIYRSMMQAEQNVRRGLWSGRAWRRLWLEQGTVRELDEGADEP